MNRIGFLRRDICECLFFWNDIRMIVSEIWQWDCCKGGLLALISSWVDWWINVLRADGAGDRRSNLCSLSQYNYYAGSAYSTSLIAFFVRIWGLEFGLTHLGLALLCKGLCERLSEPFLGFFSFFHRLKKMSATFIVVASKHAVGTKLRNSLVDDFLPFSSSTHS